MDIPVNPHLTPSVFGELRSIFFSRRQSPPPGAKRRQSSSDHPGQAVDRHVAVRLTPAGSWGNRHTQDVHEVLKLQESGRRPSMCVPSRFGTVTRLGVCSDSAGFSVGRFAPRITLTTVELAILGFARLQSRPDTLEPRCFRLCRTPCAH